MGRCEHGLDGVPANQDKVEGPTGPTGSFANSNVQAMAQIVEKTQNQAIGLNDQNVSSFVHLIT